MKCSRSSIKVYKGWFVILGSGTFVDIGVVIAAKDGDIVERDAAVWDATEEVA